MMNFVFYTHSGIRYLVVLAGLITIGYALYGAIGRRPYDKVMRISAGMFAGLMHLNILLGLGLIMMGRFYPQLAGHIFTMIFCAITAQIVPSVMRRRPEEERTYLPHAIGAVIAFGLLWGGVTAIQRPLIPGLF